MAEFQCWCVWNLDKNSDFDYNVDLDLLPISIDLKKKAISWMDELDSIYDIDDPASASFSSAEDLRAFNAKGEELLREFKKELPDASWDLYIETL